MANQYTYANDDAGRDGYVSEFDAQRAALARRRRIAQLLQEQSMKEMPIVDPRTGGRTSWLAPIAQMAQAAAGEYAGKKADEEMRAQAAGQDAAMQKDIAAFPQGQEAIPAQSMGPPTPDTQQMPKMVPQPLNFGPDPNAQPTLGGRLSGPAAPMGGMLPQPPQQIPTAPPPPAPTEPAGMATVPGQMSEQPGQAAVPSSPMDLLSYAAKMAKYGGIGAKVGEHAANLGMDRMFPKQLTPEVLAQMEQNRLNAISLRQAREEATQARKDQLTETERSNRVRDAEAQRRAETDDATKMFAIESRNIAAEQRAADKRDAAAKEAKLVPTRDASDSGNPLYRNPAGEQFEVVNGKPRPYTGGSMPSEALEKEVVIVRTLDQGLKSGARLLKVVEDNKDAFGPSNILGRTPVVGGLIRERLFSKDELDAQAAVSKDAADVINKLYGAALSMGEQKRAESFVPSADDPPALLQSKLRKALEWAQEKRSSQSGAARNVASQRAGGTTRAPAGATGGWGAAVRE